MGADLRAEPVLERGDDPAAVGVVLRVGRREEDEVEREADLVAAHLDVALLEHVEETDLDALGEVGQLVDGEDAAVRAGDEAVVERELVGQVAALGHLDRVDLADQVGDRRVRGGELLAVATRPVDPLDRGVLAVLGHQLPAVARHRLVGIVVDLRAGDDRHPLVEEAGERADHAGLRLAALAQEDHVVAGEQGVLELREHRVLVALHDHGEEHLAGLDAGDGVAAQLLLHRHRDPPRLAELADRGGRGVRGSRGHEGQPIAGPVVLCPGDRAGTARISDRYPRLLHGGARGTWRAAVADDDLRRTWHEDAFDDAGWEAVDVPGHWRSVPGLRRHRRPAPLPALRSR